MKTQKPMYKSDFRPTQPQAPSAQAALVLAVLATMDAPQRHRIVTRAPLPHTPVELKNATLVPWQLDTCPLPPEAWKPIVALQLAGVKPLGYVIGHERKPTVKEVVTAPVRAQLTDRLRQTKAHVDNLRAQAGPIARKAAQRANDLAETVEPTMVMIGKAAVKAAPMVAAAALAMTLGTLGVLAYAIAADPILFCLVAADDGGDPVWIEIARWFAEE
jgi:hypothetical protein